MLQGLFLARCWFLECYMCWCRDFLLSFSKGHLFPFAAKPLWVLDNPRLSSYPKALWNLWDHSMLCSWTHIIFLYVENTHLLQGLNVFKEKSPIVWEVSGSSFLFNLERWRLLTLASKLIFMKCPLSVPWNLPFPSMTVSTIYHENIIPWDRRAERLRCSPLQTDVRTFPSSQSHGRLLAESYSSCTSAEGKSFQQKLEGDLILPPPAKQAQHLFLSRWHPDGLI